MLRVIFKALFFVVEKFLAEVAIVAAILSLVWTGTYVSRIMGGIYSVIRLIFELLKAYAQNQTFVEMQDKLGQAIMNAIHFAGDNIQRDPQRAFLAVLATYVTYKVIAIVLKVFRKTILKKTTESIPRSSRPTVEKEEKVTEHLYGEKKSPTIE